MLEVEEAAVDDLMSFYRQGLELRDFDTGIQYALARILSDPRFVYRFEREPENINVGESYAISGYELASRLSFFLWSSIPDDELMRAAAAGDLRQPRKLEQQIDRMLADPRADALVGIWGLSCDRAGFQGGRIKRVIVALVRVPTGVTADGLALLANNFAHALLRIDTAPLAAS